MSFGDWVLNYIDKATRWRGNTPDNNGCAHDCEGGVDIPLPAGTPIYALASGPLIGNGPWRGHGVITQQVAGLGKLYYQHLDVLPSFPQCANGTGCNLILQAGTLLGYSNADVGEVEVGINPAWGGIWGPAGSGADWVLDPRPILKSLAGGAMGTCKDTGVAGFTTVGCGPCQYKDSSTRGRCIQCSNCQQPAGCVSCGIGAAATSCCSPSTCIAGVCVSGNPFGLPGWITNPDWNRVFKFVLGFVLLAAGLGLVLITLSSQAANSKPGKAIGKAAKFAGLAA